MRLTDVFKPECILAGSSFSGKTAALECIAATAKRCHLLDEVKYKDVLRGLQQRERLGSTGFGQGIAIPHCRLDRVPDFVMGMITVPQGLAFKALDGQAVKLIIFIIGPTGRADQHLRLLSAISHTLLIPGVVKGLLAEGRPEAVRENFLRHAPADFAITPDSDKALSEIPVKHGNKFHARLVGKTVFDTFTAGDIFLGGTAP